MKPLYTRILVSLLLLGAVSVAQAVERMDLELASGDALSIDRYPGAGRRLLLWIPPEEGFGPGQAVLARGLADEGVDVWALRLHSSFMLAPGNRSLEKIRSGDLLPVLDRARAEGFDQLFLMSSRRGARLALKLAYRWQLEHPEQDAWLRGLLLFSPQLTSEQLRLGRAAGYQPIAGYSNLPLYLMIPELSTKYALSREIAGRLERGGSQVFVHLLKGVRDQFHLRPQDDLAEADLKMRRRLPRMIANALDLLALTGAAPLRAGWVPPRPEGASGLRAPGLHEIEDHPASPALRLPTLDGRRLDLAELKGEVVLINFWATWCAPCVGEMPSLSRLARRFRGRRFRIIGVNIGEQPEAVQRFLRRIPVDFDILLDRQRRAVRDWKVYAYPSNFLVDAEGRIRYGYKGALDWDAPAITRTIESLL